MTAHEKRIAELEAKPIEEFPLEVDTLTGAPETPIKPGDAARIIQSTAEKHGLTRDQIMRPQTSRARNARAIAKDRIADELGWPGAMIDALFTVPKILRGKKC